MFKKILFTIGAFLLCSNTVLACGGHQVVGIEILHPWAWETYEGQKTAGDFMDLSNKGLNSDILLTAW